jgi:CheY-like chemotaxis protein
MTVLILVVDDGHDEADLFRQQFRRDLRSQKFVMDFAYSGAEAVTYSSYYCLRILTCLE